MSTVTGFVGGGIGFLLQQWIRLLMYEEDGAAVWAIAIVVAALDYPSAKVREKVVGGGEVGLAGTDSKARGRPEFRTAPFLCPLADRTPFHLTRTHGRG